MIFSRRIKQEVNDNIKIDNTIIKTPKKLKYLGVWLDHKLAYKNLVKNCREKSLGGVCSAATISSKVLSTVDQNETATLQGIR